MLYTEIYYFWRHSSNCLRFTTSSASFKSACVYVKSTRCRRRRVYSYVDPLNNMSFSSGNRRRAIGEIISSNSIPPNVAPPLTVFFTRGSSYCYAVFAAVLRYNGFVKIACRGLRVAISINATNLPELSRRADGVRTYKLFVRGGSYTCLFPFPYWPY